MGPIQIKLTPTELRRQRPVKTDAFYITLYENSFRFVFEMLCEEPVNPDDIDGAWAEQKNDYDIRCLKHQIVCIQKEWSDYNERWKISIEANGVADTFRFFFKSKSRCTEVFNTIGAWWLGDEWIKSE